MSLDDIFDAFDEGDNHLTAKLTIAHLVETDSLDLLVPVVANYVQLWRREPVRKRERAALAYRPPAPDLTETWVKPKRSLTPVDNRKTPARHRRWKALLNDWIDLGDKVRVQWGEATAEQLRQRRAAVSKQIVGNQRTLDTIDLALADLEATGAGCLNELVERKL